jgi:hypothetical protein
MSTCSSPYCECEKDQCIHGLRDCRAARASTYITDAQVAAAERELWMGGMRDVSSEVVREALGAALPPQISPESLNWLLTQCEQYQQRAHKAELELLKLKKA